MKKTREQKAEELEHILTISQNLMCKQLKMSNQTYRLFTFMSFVNAKLAVAMLQLEYGHKKGNAQVWVTELKEKFQSTQQLVQELISE